MLFWLKLTITTRGSMNHKVLDLYWFFDSITNVFLHNFQTYKIYINVLLALRDNTDYNQTFWVSFLPLTECWTPEDVKHFLGNSRGQAKKVFIKMFPFY